MFFSYIVYIPIIFFCSSYVFAQQIRVKEIVNIRGVRSNELVGYGLVVGLSKTGDSAASVTTQKAAAMALTSLGIKTKPEDIQAGNIASVIVTAKLPPFAKVGDKVDVRLSATGDASSLAGGTLLLTPLKSGDDHVYVVSQGAVIVGQASGQGTGVLTVARVPGGGNVEREFTPNIAADGYLQLNLKEPDFSTSSRLSKEINRYFRGYYAESSDAVSVKIKVPATYLDKIVNFVAELENLKIEVDRKAKVVLNERTGTIVLGNKVTIEPITIAHGELSIKISDNQEGDEDVSQESLVTVGGTTVGHMVETLNSLGVKPKDLIGIFQAISAAGALNGELEFL